MRSIGTRMTVWYAVASLATFWCLFRSGSYLVEHHAVHDLDLLNAAEFEQIRHQLGPDYELLDAAAIRERLRTTTEFSTILVGVEIRKDGRTVFRSDNLNDRAIPDVPMKPKFFSEMVGTIVRHIGLDQPPPATATANRDFNAIVGDIGEMRVGEFTLGSLVVRIATSKQQIHSTMIAYRDVFYGLLVIMFIASAIIGYGLSRIPLRPLRIIEETATHISSQNLSERIPVAEVDDELLNFARLLNATFDRLETAFNQTRRFTAEASHELKTPLSLVRLQTEKLLIDGGLTAAQEDAVQIQLEEITRLNKIIEELLFLSRAEANAITLSLQRQDPRPFLQSFVQDAAVLAEHRRVRFVDHISGKGAADFDSKWIRQVLFNLVANALNVSPPGGVVVLTSELLGSNWRVAVEDQGPGVPAEQRERIFERFVRLETGGRQDDTGSGLGLAISRSIVGLHRGTIRAEPGENGSGLRVIFQIPASARKRALPSLDSMAAVETPTTETART